MDIQIIKNKCLQVIADAPQLPNGIRQHCVYGEKHDQRVYPGAYIPFVGREYGTTVKILFIGGTSQNLSGRNAQLIEGYISHPRSALERLCLDEKGSLDIGAHSVASGVFPALAGLLIASRGGIIEKNLSQILQYMAYTNFYKFSLWTKTKRVLHPEMLRSPLADNYADFMLNNYITKEIDILSPDYIFVSSKLAHAKINKFLSQINSKIKLYRIEDPTWLFFGASGVWGNTALSLCPQEEELLDFYCERIRVIVGSKRNLDNTIKQVANYLRYYFCLMKEDC